MRGQNEQTRCESSLILVCCTLSAEQARIALTPFQTLCHYCFSMTCCLLFVLHVIFMLGLHIACRGRGHKFQKGGSATSLIVCFISDSIPIATYQDLETSARRRLVVHTSLLLWHQSCTLMVWESQFLQWCTPSVDKNPLKKIVLPVVTLCTELPPLLKSVAN